MLDAQAWPQPGRWVAWVGIQHGVESREGSVNLLNLDTRRNVSHILPGRPGFVAATDRPGVLLVGLEHELALLDISSDVPVLSGPRIPVTDDPRTIINDGLATPFGVVFGTKELNIRDPLAHLYYYRYGAERVTVLRAGQVCSNGKVLLKRDSKHTLLDIDTPTRTVVRYDFDVEAGTVGEPRVFLDLTHRPDYPDGMCLTPDARSIVIAFYNPHDAPYGVARQYGLATGGVEIEWRTVGSPRVTCPCFVETEAGIKLLLTTAVEGMTPEELTRHPEAGSLFIGDTGLEGRPSPGAKVKL